MSGSLNGTGSIFFVEGVALVAAFAVAVRLIPGIALVAHLMALVG